VVVVVVVTIRIKIVFTALKILPTDVRIWAENIARTGYDAYRLFLEFLNFNLRILFAVRQDGG
jgi:hypothetical protein